MTKERTITSLELMRAYVSGNPGWVRASWTRADGSGGGVTIRLRRRTETRWYIADLLVSLPTTALLRDIPLARIETAVNADLKIREWLMEGEPAGTAKPAETVKLARKQAVVQRTKLKRPNSRNDLTDAFFAHVADAYRGAAAAGLPPARTLAIESDTPQGTVNRWIAKAREDDHLAEEAEPGKVTT